MSQGLGGVRQVAREKKQERFTALLHHLTVDLLRQSYYALKRNAAPGVDGVRWSEYEAINQPCRAAKTAGWHRKARPNGTPKRSTRV